MVCTFVTSCCYLLSNMEYVSPCQSWAVNIGARLHDMSEYVRVGLIKRLIPGNFNWFLHTMLFFHTKQVIYKQMRKESQEDKEDSGDDE